MSLTQIFIWILIAAVIGVVGELLARRRAPDGIVGAIVVGFNESAKPIDATTIINRSMRAFFLGSQGKGVRPHAQVAVKGPLRLWRAQAKCTSPMSFSSIGRSHVGHHQRASPGVPQAA